MIYKSESARARAIMKVYDKLQEGKLGAHWLWCVIERVADGEAEASALNDYEYAPASPESPDLSEQLTRAKNLLVKLWDKFPETRSMIEGHTGPWFVWGTDRDSPLAAKGETS